VVIELYHRRLESKDMDITVTSSVLVPSATPPPHHVLWVSNIDVCFRIHGLTAYIYRPVIDSDMQTVCQGLREALSKGALFLEAFTELKIDDLEDMGSRPSELQSLLPTVSYSEDISALPLLILKVTMFKCVGIGLGVGISHIVCDGLSAINFINTWCDIARGLDVNVGDLHIDRTLLRARSPPQPTFAHQELWLQSPPLLIHKLEREGGDVSFVMFRVSKGQLISLKAIEADNPIKRIYTTFVSLSAHVWKCYCIARGFSKTQEVILHTPVDGRRQLHTPRGYLGNVVFPADVRAVSGDIMSKPIWYIF
ncbi:hypothetical protein KI387_038555, partial [Taxus chinensis]